MHAALLAIKAFFSLLALRLCFSALVFGLQTTLGKSPLLKCLKTEGHWNLIRVCNRLVDAAQKQEKILLSPGGGFSRTATANPHSKK